MDRSPAAGLFAGGAGLAGTAAHARAQPAPCVSIKVRQRIINYKDRVGPRHLQWFSFGNYLREKMAVSVVDGD